ncbi:PhaM family polyhydroxyalkanoate granule multifunctional regulatory protein [Achromobacter sp. Marseille-Q4962]|uniref:PhaM family polyhydroxyalkanoate granule multifunctional regulatory protein n=1 Tax=Achromobacter sp. Marseille-Q4962 TaxID=2942202 RepID=UPI0020745BE8|nr:PhaM family polyhydroxyalkanoate granule multifunctional regulatory protein [Achromobacter sp. Marseille-Q4962]
MSDQHSNPFVLPGLGQSSELSGNPLLASMEMMRQAWAGLTGPGGLASSLPIAPPMNLEELDRRIAELRSVENWLRMNLSMLSSTIQGMEVQRSTISTLRAFVDSAANLDMSAVRDSGAASPLEVVLGIKPAPRQAEAAAPEPDKAGGEGGAAQAGASAQPPGPGMSEQMGQAAQSASKAWWDLLQRQFSQIAAATAATMPSAQAAQPPQAAQGAAAGAQTRPASKTQSKAAAKTASKAARKSAPRARKNGAPSGPT